MTVKESVRPLIGMPVDFNLDRFQNLLPEKAPFKVCWLKVAVSVGLSKIYKWGICCLQSQKRLKDYSCISLMSMWTILLGGGVVDVISYLYSWRKKDVVKISLKTVCDDMISKVPSGSLVMCPFRDEGEQWLRSCWKQFISHICNSNLFTSCCLDGVSKFGVIFF